MSVIPHHSRPRADGRPDIGVPAFLADPGFVLEPDFYGTRDSVLKRGFDEAGEVFLKVASASGGLLRMLWPRLQAREPQFVKPSADRALVNFHRKPAGHLVTQVYAPPARHLMHLQVWTFDDKRSQLSSLCLSQRRPPTGGT